MDGQPRARNRDNLLFFRARELAHNGLGNGSRRLDRQRVEEHVGCSRHRDGFRGDESWSLGDLGGCTFEILEPGKKGKAPRRLENTVAPILMRSLRYDLGRVSSVNIL